MKKLLLILLIAFVANAKAQDFIYRTTGDTLKCKIENVDKSKVYYKLQGIPTAFDLSLENVVSYGINGQPAVVLKKGFKSPEPVLTYNSTNPEIRNKKRLKVAGGLFIAGGFFVILGSLLELSATSEFDMDKDSFEIWKNTHMANSVLIATGGALIIAGGATMANQK